MIKILVTILSISFGLNSFAQTSDVKKEAYEIALKAIKLMDNGDIEGSIGLLEKSEKLDPKNFLYPYEIGFAYFQQKNYKKAIKILKKVIDYDENNDQCFTLLGNVYDVNKQPEKAIETYKKGLIKFPKSGRLHFEQGNVQEVLKKYNEALSSWENGIIVSPSYPSNYHTASIYYCKYTTEKVWGMIYGELFMNIERGSNKTIEISKLLFDTYKSSITIKSETEGSVSFSKSMQMALPEEGKEMKLPFTMHYETTAILSMATELNIEEINISFLNNIRTNFIINWYKKKLNIEYPNALFDWHKKLIDLGHFKSYNYWLLMKGNETEFNKWVAKNKDQFNEFVDWFSENPLTIDEQNNFSRLQYN